MLPARTTRLTGRYSHNGGVFGNAEREHRGYTYVNRESIPVTLRRNEHVRMNHDGEVRWRHGYTDQYARWSSDHLEQLSQQRRPFFAMVGHLAPHFGATGGTWTSVQPAERDRDSLATTGPCSGSTGSRGSGCPTRSRSGCRCWSAGRASAADSTTGSRAWWTWRPPLAGVARIAGMFGYPLDGRPRKAPAVGERAMLLQTGPNLTNGVLPEGVSRSHVAARNREGLLVRSWNDERELCVGVTCRR